jgi:leucyl/phenylalanyl-tRNA--protein transferase
MFVCQPGELVFPPVEQTDENGILAVGGDLSEARLMLAYHSGIFPWYDDDTPIIWWSPDPRFVLFPDRLHVSKSMQRIIRGTRFRHTWDEAFPEVIRHCKVARGPKRESTWITPEMEAAYIRLHRAGHAHSVEVWEEGELVGGLYGVVAGRCFCGESMFSSAPNASKFALIKLVEHIKTRGLELIDSQVPNSHMESMGAEVIPRDEYLKYLT